MGGKSEKMVSIELTREHAFVFFVAIGGYIVNQILGNLVNVARGRFKIPVPFLYANHGMFLKDGKIDEVALKTRGVASSTCLRATPTSTPCCCWRACCTRRAPTKPACCTWSGASSMELATLGTPRCDWWARPSTTPASSGSCTWWATRATR